MPSSDAVSRASEVDTAVVQELLPGVGSIGALPNYHNYKRAVLRQPPKYFVVEVLQPQKFGNGYCYGMRVYPTSSAGLSLNDAVSTKSGSTSSSSSGSNRTSTLQVAYDIWRRWEDCLWFQDILETEYKVMARSKRIRLQRGKGVKKDGIYIHSDQAASFDSLPPGPDANTIAKDIHDILPKLTKKGTLFRAGKDTIEQRHKEFKALVEKLLDDDVPMLVKELRDSRLVKDFFGYWRRDKDHDRKAATMARSDSDKGKDRTSRASMASSAFSMYFSASNISLQLPNAFSDYPPSPSVASSFSPSSSTATPNKVSKLGTHAVKKTESFSSSSSSSTSLSVPSSSRSRIVSVPQSIAASSIWMNGPRTPTSPMSHVSFTVADNGSLIPASPFSEVDDPLNSAIIFVPSGDADSKSKPLGGLQVLPEEQEQELAEGVTDMTLSSSSQANSPTFSPSLHSAPPFSTHQDFPPPVRRPRNMSCPDPGVRNGLIFPARSRTHSTVSEQSIQSPSLSTTSSEGIQSEEWEDALDGFGSEYSEGEQDGLSRRASMRSIRTSRSIPRGSPQRPFTMYSTFSSFSQQESYFDDLDLGGGLSLDEVLEAGADSAGEESTITRRTHHPRASVATMNSIMSNSSVDAVLPRRGLSMSPSRPMSLHRPASPTPSFSPSASPEQSYVRSASPTPSSSPTLSILQTPGANLQRSRSNGSRIARNSIAGSDLSVAEGKWYEGDELPDEDFIDSYFYDPGMQLSGPGYETPRRERVSRTVTEISTPEHFPKPFQHRPPGQFHIPWSPTDSAHSSQISISPTLSTPSSATSGIGNHFTIKAVRQDSIVLLRATHSMTLAQVREKLRDKFASQEGIKLTDSFNIGFNPSPTDARQKAVAAIKDGARPRSQSTSALAPSDGQPRLRFITNDADWEQATADCSTKLTIHIFDRF